MPDLDLRFLDYTWQRNTIAAWLTAAAVLVLGWLALLVVRGFVTRRLERVAARTATPVDDLLLGGLRRTSKWFLLVAALAAAVQFVRLPADARDAVRLVARVAFLLQAASWGTGAITFWLHRVQATRAEHDKASIGTLNLLAIIARVVLWVIVFLAILGVFGVNITALVTGLGIAGVAVALAVQNVLGDLLASLSIALDKPFVVGDFIVVDTFMGTVEDIGLKTTRLRSLSGERIVMPNGELLKARIRNHRGQVERRVLFTLLFPLDTSPDAMERVPTIVREVVGAQETARLDRTHFGAITDQAFAVETVYFVTTGDFTTYMDTQQRINLALLRRFAAEGITLALPTRSVLVRGTGGEGAPADGNGLATGEAHRAAIAGASGAALD